MRLARRATILTCAFLLAGCGDSRREEPFDKARWSRADLSTRARADMVPDLLRRHSLEGQSRSAILALLGMPTPTDKWASTQLVYALGPDPGMGIDHEWLLIELDASHRVVSHAIVQD